MKWKCNTFGCEHIFENNQIEDEFEKSNSHSLRPICPKCKDKNNRSYRVR